MRKQLPALVDLVAPVARLPRGDLLRALLALPRVTRDHDLEVAVAGGGVEEALARVAVEGGRVVGEEVRQEGGEEVLGSVHVGVVFVAEVRGRGRRRTCRGGRLWWWLMAAGEGSEAGVEHFFFLVEVNLVSDVVTFVSDEQRAGIDGRYYKKREEKRKERKVMEREKLSRRTIDGGFLDLPDGPVDLLESG
ncbi:hypothetical protein VTN02DRAFT_1412 [Thermoascus thermophilus]